MEMIFPKSLLYSEKASTVFQIYPYLPPLQHFSGVFLNAH
jgi:hypothetical protein